jgi:hypothetical protein
MTRRALLRKLRRLGARVVTGRGKGGHVLVVLQERRAFVPTGSEEIKREPCSASSGASGFGSTI